MKKRRVSKKHNAGNRGMKRCHGGPKLGFAMAFAKTHGPQNNAQWDRYSRMAEAAGIDTGLWP